MRPRVTVCRLPLFRFIQKSRPLARPPFLPLRHSLRFPRGARDLFRFVGFADDAYFRHGRDGGGRLRVGPDAAPLLRRVGDAAEVFGLGSVLGLIGLDVTCA